MRFASLGSGSRGNATLVEADGTLVMVDCGFSLSETVRRLTRLGVEPATIAAILVTHEHGDHIRGVARFAARYGVTVWMTPGTCAASREEITGFTAINVHEDFEIGGLQVSPLAVPHDAREPSQFIFSDGSRRLGILTDTGSVTPHIVRGLSSCHALILESNHDHAMLMNGPYPAVLKKRVGGPLGHLSNQQAAELVMQLDCGGLQHLVAAHLSDKNNTPGMARAALAAAANCTPAWIAVADQDKGLDWRVLA